MLFNLALVLSSVYIVTRFALAAVGSGIPEINGYLNGVDAPGILLFRTLIGKVCSNLESIGFVGGALTLGKEGPLVKYVHLACIRPLSVDGLIQNNFFVMRGFG
ncbi:Chloride channel protein [Nymphaea thermarum]|nr:Chloride channel protein [Nymphaea thermarum]